MRVIPPCLNVSHLAPISKPLPAVELHEGWTAASKGEPQDYSQPRAWQVGWMLWWRVKWFGPSPAIWRT